MKRRLLRVDEQQDGTKLDEFLAGALRLELAPAGALVDTGAVYVEGRRCRQPQRVLRAQEAVLVVLEESGRSTLQYVPPAPSALEILWEDADLLAVNKPAGQVAQPTVGRVGESLLDAASRHLGRLAGLVHRLDRETSGVTVFGKGREATSALAAQFRERTASKQYLAAVVSPASSPLPARGTFDWPLSRDPSRPGRFRASRTANGQEAVTEFERLYEGHGFALVLLAPRTGRTHQLRAHLTAAGAPILGDGLYGGPPDVAGLAAPRCLLHAHRLELAHPRTGNPLVFIAPLPADLAAFFRQAGVDLPA